MIGEVQKALTAYNKLDGTGKRLFRDELGLVRPQQARPRRKRAAKSADGVTAAEAPKRGRPRRIVADAPVAETLGV